jgi:hypothetical protein
MRQRLLILFCTLALLSQSIEGAAAAGAGERLSGADGVPRFITGMNYEGPADRAWQMWSDSNFDAAAVDADFERAAAGGFNTIRLFVQSPLLADISAGKWSKLDQVVSLAEKNKVQLIVSLYDYGERDLGKVATVAGKVAEHYRGRTAILAFDLKNEPRFNDLSWARYASPPPLQQQATLAALGERLPRAEVAAFRASPDGLQSVSAMLTDDEAWLYVNYLRLYREMLNAAAEWVKAGGYRSTTLDYLDDPAGQRWAPLVSALNGTLEAWLSPQVQAVRTADPQRAITLDHVDVVLARLPANDLLDFQSLHRYPAAGAASIRAALSLAATLERNHPTPYLLSEFGYATDALDADRASLHETAIMLGLVSQGAAGGAKWMLNDMPAGFNMRERTLGAFRLDGTPKPVVAATTALQRYLSSSGAAPGDFTLQDDRDVGLRYVYRASDALLLGGKTVDGGSASMDAAGPAQVFLSWSEPSTVRVWASGPLKLTVDLGQLTGQTSTGKQDLTLSAGERVLQVGSPVKRPADYGLPNGRFYTQTNGRTDSPAGFSVTDEANVPLWTAFQSLGGVDVLGYPVTRRFELDGFVVQGFQKAVLQWRPEQKTFNFLNTFDMLHDRGKDAWLEAYRQTPRPGDTAADAGLPWARVMDRHLALLDQAPPALKDRFLADPSWLDHYGLPVAVKDMGSSVVVRAQRATLQYWKETVPWAASGSVSIANGGDLAKEAGVFPWLAVTPENAPR